MTKEKIEIDSNIVRFGKGGYISLDDFPNRFSAAVKKFDDSVKDANCHTRRLEQEGARLTKSAMSQNKSFDKAEVSQFLDRVIRWGGSMGNKIFWMIDTKYKSRERIIKSIPVAARFLNEGKFQEAINKIILPKPCGLGVSFGSKILRMLNPEKVGVYDKVLAEGLANSKSAAPSISRWINFCDDCATVAAELKKRGIKNPERKNGKWFVADVEVVIFGHYWKSDKS